MSHSDHEARGRERTWGTGEHDAEVVSVNPYNGCTDYRCRDCGLTWRDTLSEENAKCPPEGRSLHTDS